MKKITITILSLCCTWLSFGQNDDFKEKIESLEYKKELIVAQEKQALKEEVAAINSRLNSKEISKEEAQQLKKTVAEKRALNIENRLAIIDNEIALLERNKGQLVEIDSVIPSIEIDWGTERESDERLFGVLVKGDKKKKKVRYDRRTYSEFVWAIGFNNAIIEGQNLEESPYRLAGSRFFEFGWQWRTRIFKKTNFARFHYGFSFQFNGLKPEGNQYLVDNGMFTELQEFDNELTKSKFRIDNLVFPVHLEFGPSKKYESDSKIRYSIRRQFRIALGGYGGFNIGTRQKLKYTLDGENIKDKLKRDYNTNSLIYGLSGYVGIGCTALYVKYDLNTIFEDHPVDQNNISVGLRFDF